MQADDPTEFFDVAQRNKKFGRVDRENGVLLIEKYVLPFTLILPEVVAVLFSFPLRLSHCRSNSCWLCFIGCAQQLAL